MAEEVNLQVGPKEKYKARRTASRHGTDRGRIVIGSRRAAVLRPRVHGTVDEEMALETYARFQHPALQGGAAPERMLHQWSCRGYGHGLGPVGQGVEPIGTSKSALDRRFVVLLR